MKHCKSVSRVPVLALSTGGNLTLLEQLIIFGLGIVFGDWQNYPQVVQNLQKYYRKTPAG